MPNGYTQASKNCARENLLTHAVNILTERRHEASCVRRSYVRDLKRYFVNDTDTETSREAGIIDNSYICSWEQLHSSCVGHKRPDELKICYLAGPEPMNDFEVLKDQGILPQNIWAFESSNNEYSSALEQCCGSGFDQPKLIRMRIERFLEIVPMSFDIVYLDFCASFISSRQALRCISTLFYHHRLASPGVLITNFAEAELAKRNDYIEMMARYFLFKDNPGLRLKYTNYSACETSVRDARNTIANDFEQFYGDFISLMLCNLSSTAIPSQRFSDSAPAHFLSPNRDQSNFCLSLDYLDGLEADSLLRFLACSDECMRNHPLFLRDSLFSELKKELSPLAEKDPLDAIIFCERLRNGSIAPADSILSIARQFEGTYRFLDKPRMSLYLDYVIRQFAYPAHANPARSLRITYKAKSTRMFADALVFDDCRYIYDWLPAAFQGEDVVNDRSWFYVFRFALDGLVKQRLVTGSDYFYMGSVIQDCVPGFETIGFADRQRIN